MKTLLPIVVALLSAAVGKAQENPPSSETGGEIRETSAGWLGITLESDGTAVRVASVAPGSPAEKSGVETGAIIAGIDGITVRGDSDAVSRAIRAKKPGEEVELQWRMENNLKAVRIKLASKLASSIQEDAIRLQKSVKPPLANPAEPKEGDLRKDREREGFRFTPVPEARPFEPAERQLRKIAPEVELDPFEKVDGENAKNWKTVPPFKAAPAFPESPRAGDIQKLKEEFESLKVDPYQLEGKAESILPARADLDLKLEPARERKVDDLIQQESQSPGYAELELKQEARRARAAEEKDDWEGIQKRVAAALEKSDLEPELKKRVMEALGKARSSEREAELAQREADMLKKARQTRLETELMKLENQMRDQLEQARKLRQELQELRK